MDTVSKEPKPKVAIVLPFFGDGGMERAMINLAKGLLSENIEVHFVLLKKGYGTFTDEIPREAKIIEFYAKNFIDEIFKLSSYLKKENPNAVLSLSTPANLVSVITSMLTKGERKIIVSTQVAVRIDESTTKLKAFFRPFVYGIYNLADVVHAVSSGVAEDLKSFGVKKEKIKIIYNAVISPDILKQGNEQIRHPWFNGHVEGVPVILNIARLVPQKDLPTLLCAFALVRKKKNIRLAIIGEGPLRLSLLALAKDLGVEKDFELLGFLGNPYPYIKKANIFVLSSAWEGFCVALAEALAFGIPVVSTDCSHGPGEVLEYGKYGKLTPVGDAQALAEAIIETLEQPLASEFLKSGAERFSIKNITKEYLQAFGL